MNIRFANPSDIPAMIALLQQVGEVHHQIRPDLFRAGAQKYDEAALLRLLAEENRPIFIAEEDGVLGYCFCILQITENDPVLCDRRVIYIDDLCVDASVRGKGVAGALYDAVLAYGRENRFDAVTLNVWCGNDRAMNFYEKVGMKPQKVGMEITLC